MKKLKYCIVAIILLGASNGYSQHCTLDWQNQDCYSQQPRGTLFSPDNKVAWLFGYNAYYHTTDGGTTWKIERHIDGIYDNCGDSLHMNILNGEYGVLYLQYSNGHLYCGGSNILNLVTRFLSDDNGKTWRNTGDTLLIGGGMYGGKYEKAYTSDSVGYKHELDKFIPWPMTNDNWIAKMYKTTDGGASWFVLPGIHDTLGTMHFFNDSAGFVETDPESEQVPSEYQIPRTYRTTDGGAMWEYSPLPYFLPDYYYADSGSNVLSGAGNYKPNGLNDYLEHSWDLYNAILIPKLGVERSDTIWRTWDAGKTWHIIASAKEAGLVDSAGDSLWKYGVQPIRLQTVKFLDTLCGYAAGSYGGVFRTVDGGRHWALMNVGFYHKNPDGSSGAVTRYGGLNDATLFTDIWMQDSMRVRLYGDAAEHTTDGGAHWYYDYGDCYPTRTWAMQMLDSCWGWANGPEGGLLHTTNSGKRWKYVTLPPLNNYPLYWGAPYVNIYSIDFLNIQNGWVGGDLGVIYRTTTGGKTWTRRDLPFGYKVMALTFLTSSHGWAEDNAGALWETSDAGAHWTRRMKSLFIDTSAADSDVITRVGNLAPAYTISFPTPRIGYYADLYQVHKTTDGGATWDTLLGSNTNVVGEPIVVQFINANTGWLSTNEGYYYRTTDGGATWTNIYGGNTSIDYGGKLFPVDTNIIWGPISTTDGWKTRDTLPTNIGNIETAFGKDLVWSDGYAIIRWAADTSCCNCPWNEPEITPNTRFLDFDTVLINTTKTATLTLANTGTYDLLISSTHFANQNDTDVLTLIPANLLTSIPPGDSVSIKISFTPKSVGLVNDTLIVSNSDPLETEAAIAISGEGVNQVSVREDMLPNQTTSAYPNPFSTLTTISLSGIPAALLRAKGATLRVYNMLGVQVADLTPLLNGQQTIEFDASALPPGVYVVKGNFGAKQFVQKLAVEK